MLHFVNHVEENLSVVEILHALTTNKPQQKKKKGAK